MTFNLHYALINHRCPFHRNNFLRNFLFVSLLNKLYMPQIFLQKNKAASSYRGNGHICCCFLFEVFLSSFSMYWKKIWISKWTSAIRLTTKYCMHRVICFYPCLLANAFAPSEILPDKVLFKEKQSEILIFPPMTTRAKGWGSESCEYFPVINMVKWKVIEY